MEPPAENEINPIPDDLDGQVAVRHFLGKSVEDAVELFKEDSLIYQEDLMWMGPKAFCYYLPAVQNYFAAQADGELVPFIVSVLEFRLDHDASEVQAAGPTMVAICEHLLAQDDDYVEPKGKRRCRDILRRIE